MDSPTSAKRCLIVNADDFGLSAGVNRGILAAHQRGIVTSTSLMVRGPAAGEVTAAMRQHPGLSVGLHVDLGEWAYRDGGWFPLYQVLPPAEAESAEAVEAEFARQLERFRELAGRDPTHLDSHQHVHRSEPLRSVLLDAAARLGVPLRHFDPRVRYCGDFYGQADKGRPHPGGITAESLLAILAELPTGITELACHPGLGDDHASPYRAERPVEVAALCDPRVASAAVAAGIELMSFRDL